MRDGRGPRRAGFTLVELLVVMAIIGIIISLILVAASDGVRRAEERATQSLITKLDFAMNDRIDALLNTQAPINQTHRYLAAINAAIGGVNVPIPGSIEGRAQVIAQNDFIRAELPDVFFLNEQTSDGASLAGSYPLNFAAVPYVASGGTLSLESFLLPLGHTAYGIDNFGAQQKGNLAIQGAGTGIFGASYAAAGGIYKNLGYNKQGYDGVDNRGEGFVDDFRENDFTADQIDNFNKNLAKHTHKTARAEMLYAILVEGLGPLGSVFNREDFTDKEVRDTDGDGLPEFTDAWGEPLQFYRWPIYYGAVPGSSDSQKGSQAYGNAAEVRQQDPLDPNNQLVAPGWWYKGANPGLRPLTETYTFSPPNGASTSTQISSSATAFSTYFRSLVDPISGGTGGTMWDRTDAMNRRAYFSKFLILSAGPDNEPGVAQFDKDYSKLIDDPTSSPYGVAFLRPATKSSVATTAMRLILIENQASQTDPVDRIGSSSGSFYEKAVTSSAGSNAVQTTGFLQSMAGTDDITNHNISAPGTGVR